MKTCFHFSGELLDQMEKSMISIFNNCIYEFQLLSIFASIYHCPSLFQPRIFCSVICLFIFLFIYVSVCGYVQVNAGV